MSRGAFEEPGLGPEHGTALVPGRNGLRPVECSANVDKHSEDKVDQRGWGLMGFGSPKVWVHWGHLFQDVP
jgi:hypothetical protein